MLLVCFVIFILKKLFLGDKFIEVQKLEFGLVRYSMIYNNINISVYYDFQFFDFFYILLVYIFVKDDYGQSFYVQRVERIVLE